ncbi:MAG TPA: AAA family ATPase, partial [Chloroflexia bacterium]|nr:AAA family ATPase [Chloroflexia bacterium]
PESDMVHGRTTLRINLLYLRQALGEASAPAGGSHLVISRDAFGFDMASGIDLDLHVLEAAWRRVQGLPTGAAVQGEVQRALITELQRAAALYRGDFLADLALRDAIEFDNWVDVQRAHWYGRIEQVFDCLARLQLAAGEIEPAIATVECWRASDPLNEDLYLRLMQLYFASGNRAAALRTYKNCAEILMAELRAKPSQSLVTLAEAIRNASVARIPARPTPLGGRPEPARALLELPFVGRGAEFGRLLVLYEQVAGGHTQVVLLTGEAGIGKSRLAAEFLGWAATQGATVLQGKAYHTHQPLPYQPLIDAVRTLVAQEPDPLALLSATWLAELSQLLPELRERYPALPAPTTAAPFAASRLWEALARLGQAAAARRPLIFLIEDIEWAGEATLDVLQYLALRWVQSATPILVLLSSRTETRTMAPPLREWLAELSSEVAVRRLELGPLSGEATLQIAVSLSAAGGGPATEARPPSRPALRDSGTADSRLSPARWGAWLFAETNGHPFYIRALLEMLLERGSLVPRLIEGYGWVFEAVPTLPETSRGGTLPPSVRERIGRRLARLAPATRELLAAGAILDHDFTFEDLCRSADLAPGDGLAALDQALESRLLRESCTAPAKEGAVLYVFAHDKIREVVYAEAGEARRRVMRGRALPISPAAADRT